MKVYSISKSRTVLKWGYGRYKKKFNELSLEQKSRSEHILENLDQAVLQGNRQTASDLAHELEAFGHDIFKKSFFEYASEFVFVITIAILVATILRQTVFEPYEIPTGSMRPTFREQDNVVVGKTAFGINMPFSTDHLYFDPDLVQRTSIVIFSGDNLNLPDNDSNYLWIFPYKKRYIKRLMGKPGDTIYFYGGKLYGIDKEGYDILELVDSSWINKIDYIPFLNIDGIVTRPKRNEFNFNQMNKSIGRMTVLPSNKVLGEIFNGQEWITDEPLAAAQPHDSIKTYSDFWGFRNYAMARLLTKQQLAEQKDLDKTNVSEGVLYLELLHTPFLNYQDTLFKQGQLGITPIAGGYKSVIPLNQSHIDILMNNMYTARFIVKNGRARRYSYEKTAPSPENPRMPGVPDGTYEFYNGIAHQIGFASIAYEVPKDHPIYSHDPAHVQALYNFGIEMHTVFEPLPTNTILYPSRYVYFRDGDLYALGAPLLNKNEVTLQNFISKEEKRQEQSTNSKPYIAFKDYGPPLKDDGSVDKEFLNTFGLKIPEGYYLTLGDNHAMSADSRVFGFVPASNLQGAPDLIVWPPGERWGPPPQKPYPWFNVPRVIVWSILGVIALIWYIVHRYNLRQPTFKKLGSKS